MRIVVHVPLSSHSRQGPGGELFVRKPDGNAGGRHFVSNPIRSSKRYELTATSATSLNQAPRACSRLPIMLGVGRLGPRSEPVFWAINPVRGRSLDSSPSFRVSDVRVADFDHACPGVDLICIAVHVLKSRHRFRIHGRDHGVELQHAQLALAEIPESDDLDS